MEPQAGANRRDSGRRVRYFGEVAGKWLFSGILRRYFSGYLEIERFYSIRGYLGILEAIPLLFPIQSPFPILPPLPILILAPA